MTKPRIADLFCGAGGAGMGLHRAGFEVVGFDIKPQPRYPFEFHEADALTVDLSGFDAVWASPPCQAYSIMRNLPWLRDKEYPRLIDPTREVLEMAGHPWIIENVMGAHLPAGWLCGTMFGLPFYRHRAFESNWFWMQPGHPKHQFTVRNGRMMGSRARVIVFSNAEDSRRKQSWPGRRGEAGNGLTLTNGARQYGSGYGHAAGVAAVREAMGIDWMKRDEITQAVPPAYSEYLGRALMQAL